MSSLDAISDLSPLFRNMESLRGLADILHGETDGGKRAACATRQTAVIVAADVAKETMSQSLLNDHYSQRQWGLGTDGEA